MLIIVIPAAATGLGLLGYSFLGGFLFQASSSILYGFWLIFLILMIATIPTLLANVISKKIKKFNTISKILLMISFYSISIYGFVNYVTYGSIFPSKESKKIEFIKSASSSNIVNFIKQEKKQNDPLIATALYRVMLKGWDSEFYEIVKYIKDPSEKIQLLIVGHKGRAISEIKNPTEKVQLLAVKDNASNIRYIKNPTEKVQSYAYGKDPSLIWYVKNPTEEQQMKSVLKSLANFQGIKNPTEKVQSLALDIIVKDNRYNGYNQSFLKYITSESVQLKIVNKYPELLQYIDKQTDGAQMKLVELVYANTIDGMNENAGITSKIHNDRELLKLIKNPTEKVQLFMVKKYVSYYLYIKNPTALVTSYAKNNWHSGVSSFEESVRYMSKLRKEQEIYEKEIKSLLKNKY